MEYRISVLRNPRTWRLRKWVVELIIFDKKSNYSLSVDARLMFGGPFFKKRLSKKIDRMISKRKEVDYIVSNYSTKK